MTKSITFAMKPMHCPKCKVEFDRVTHADFTAQRPPKPGDLSVCIRCGEILQISDGFDFEKINDERISQLSERTLNALQKMQRIARENYN